MAHIDDVKMMLAALLKSSKVNSTVAEDSEDELKAADGYDNDNPLAQTALYRDEQGQRLPNKLHVVPLFGRPVMPSQITSVQLNIEWLDIITEVISSSHHTFAMFAVGEEHLKRNKMSLSDFPKTGTMVRLLSARSSADEIDIMCEGLRRVSLIEVADPKLNLAQVRYPEIEYRLAHPTLRDRLDSNNSDLRQVIDKTMEFDKKLHAILQKQRDYAHSIGVRIKPRLNTNPDADDFAVDYYLYHDIDTIGRISLKKLTSMLEFLGIKNLTAHDLDKLAIFIATPTAAEIDRLNEFSREAQALSEERRHSLTTSLDRLEPKTTELLSSFLQGKNVTAGEAAASNDKQAAPSSASSASATPATPATPDAAAAKAAATAAAQSEQGESVPEVQPDEVSAPEEQKTLAQLMQDAKNMGLFAGMPDGRNEDEFFIGDSDHTQSYRIKSEDKPNAADRALLERLGSLLEPQADSSAVGEEQSEQQKEEQSKKRDELFALIAKIGQEEDRALQRAQERFKDAAVKEILTSTPSDADDSQKEVVKGPNIGFVNEDTSVVTFVPGHESSEELLLRLNEIQKEHEQHLRNQTNAAEGIEAVKGLAEINKKLKQKGKKGDQSTDTDTNTDTASTADLGVSINGEDQVISSGDGTHPTMLIGDNLSPDGNGLETNILIDSDDQKMPEDLKQFLGFLLQGKDASEFNVEGTDAARSGKWGALQRAALIRSKLAELLGGKVIFGVSALNDQQEGAQRDVEARAYCLGITAALQELLPLNPLITDEMRQYLAHFDMSNPSVLADCSAAITAAKPEELQEVLDTIPILPRLKLSFELVTRELSAAKLQDKIKLSVAEKIQKRQKDFFLREQLQEIKKELGLSADEKDLDIEKFRERMKKLTVPEHIQKRFDEEISKLSMLETSSPEYGLTHSYLDVLTSIPWGKTSKDKFSHDKKSGKSTISLERARKILDEDHEGLQDVKDRIIEFLAVGALKGQTAGQIMLFVGPPGVGKTSIGKSIARALNRPFYRLSLGGIDDVSEIKGHRKTYVGAMPGKIVAALRETKVMNPVIMLDEIDKLGRSYHGDPDSALLETLDPEQNKNFLDVYLDEKIDLSQCLFICTANSTDTISLPLLDRMEPIRLSGYIAKEKFAIAQKHLLPRALAEAGIKGKRSIQISDETMTTLIEGYARESGVRSLERAIAKLIRKAAVKLVEGAKKVVITSDDLEEYLGTAPFKREKMLKGVGIMTGLAWTASGGVTLPVESIVTNHDAQGFKLTGSLGDVMKESANIAYSFVQSHLELYSKLKRDMTFFKKKTVHLHVPEGAIPKDGPSAGVTMATSLLSLALNEAPQEGFAMTGELTLTGHVLPIGGLREKVIAARRMGLFNLVIPIGNEGDVKELPEQVRSNVTFYYADIYSDVAYTLFPSVRQHLEEQGYKAPRAEHFDDQGKSTATASADAKDAATNAEEAKPAKTTVSKAASKAASKAKAAPSTAKVQSSDATPRRGGGSKSASKKAPAASKRARATTATQAVVTEAVPEVPASETKAKVSKTTARQATVTKTAKTAKTAKTTKTTSAKAAPSSKAKVSKTKAASSKAPAKEAGAKTATTEAKAPLKQPSAKASGAKASTAKAAKAAQAKATAKQAPATDAKSSTAKSRVVKSTKATKATKATQTTKTKTEKATPAKRSRKKKSED
ncbi:MAG: endopeptidase La [Candidatus Anaerobiospirillum pullicola]|uniref:endopeptidase La n=1 Tax=Candidatus Anaerobiospirillum pullicola TaxID=2838451 RepID=A0A948WYS8_9GAMM|nr:endopeptidase La [Candidatus Anaerobiospirillum pullicola]